MLKEAMLWEISEENKVKCNLCAHACKISPDHLGICRVRRNDEGKLNSVIYGSVSSMNVDPIEKKPLYNFHPGSNVYSLGTIGCNFRCKHCQNSSISFADIDHSSYLREVSPEEIIQAAKERRCQGIAWTYNEPTIWFEFTYDTSILAKEEGLYTVYVTNGFMSESALDKISPYLDAANVDVKAFREDFYKDICGGSLKPVLETCERMREKGIHLELTYLVIPTKNDDPLEIREFCEWAVSIGEDIPLHFSRFHSSHHLLDLPITPIDTLETAYRIAKEAGIQYVYLGNIQSHRSENTYCPNCGEVVIERMGYNISSRVKSYDACPRCSAKLNIIG
ncbi:MAG: AmmeMemoRadiSam system radical SAM enzyme [Halobacteriota archaeon]|nr:AmmeMemoRadiSam system radical SAM enzyme [Halobacteriota archaeon]